MTTSQDPQAMGGYVFHEGDRIRKAREELDLSQEQLADRTGISRATISNYERGAKVKRVYRNQLSLILSVSTQWLEKGQLGEGDNNGIPTDNPRRHGIRIGYKQRRIQRPAILPPHSLDEGFRRLAA